jgi:hypothetical protein
MDLSFAYGRARWRSRRKRAPDLGSLLALAAARQAASPTATLHMQAAAARPTQTGIEATVWLFAPRADGEAADAPASFHPDVARLLTREQDS